MPPAEAYFYHLTESPVEETLAMLVDKARGAGWRVAVRGRDRARMEWLEERLWRQPDTTFRPVGLAGGPHDERQPVLLTWEAGPANDPQCVMAIDGAEVEAGEAAGLARLCVLFDGHDPEAVERARGQWKALTGAGLRGLYWAQEAGRWVKKAESAG